MAKEKRITVDFVFVEQTDDYDDEFKYWDLKSIERIGSGLSDEEVYSWVEGIAQSDYGYIYFPNDVWTALEKGYSEIG